MEIKEIYKKQIDFNFEKNLKNIILIKFLKMDYEKINDIIDYSLLIHKKKLI